MKEILKKKKHEDKAWRRKNVYVTVATKK